MGYTTIFDGQISVEPPLNPEEIKYLNKFADTRRMACEQGPYYVDRGGFAERTLMNPKFSIIIRHLTASPVFGVVGFRLRMAELLNGMEPRSFTMLTSGCNT
jgi:hypothetical protein